MGQPFDNHILPVGFYKFHCAVHVFISGDYNGDGPSTEASPGMSPASDGSSTAANGSSPSVETDFESGPQRPFTEEGYKLWSAWAERVTLHHLELNHFELRIADAAYDLIWREVETLIKSSIKSRIQKGEV